MTQEFESDAESPPVEIRVDLVNEQMVLATALVSRKHCDDLIARVQPDQYADPENAAAWSAVIDARRRKLAPTPETLERLSGGTVKADYIRGLMQNYPRPATNLGHHVGMLRWDHLRLSAVRGPMTDLVKALRDPTTDPSKVRALAKSLGNSFDAATDRDYMRDPVVLAAQTAQQLRKRKIQPVFPFGIEGLDKFEDGAWRLIPGAAPGKVTLVTGSSGSAKSTVTARIALGLARQRRKVLFGAWEMGNEETLELMALMSLQWSRLKVSTGDVTDDELKLFQQRCEGIGQYVRFMDIPFPHEGDRKRSANDYSIDVFHQQVADAGADVVICDLLERMLPDGRPEAERRALFRCQAIAKETRTHHIWVCQQKLKEIENRTNPRPTRSTILGSSAWVDVADTILGIHRPALWKSIADDTIQIDVLKQRFFKWPLAVQFRWDGDLCTLEDAISIAYETPNLDRGGKGIRDFVGK